MFLGTATFANADVYAAKLGLLGTGGGIPTMYTLQGGEPQSLIFPQILTFLEGDEEHRERERNPDYWSRDSSRRST
jgi:hypothetical protein